MDEAELRIRDIYSEGRGPMRSVFESSIRTKKVKGVGGTGQVDVLYF